MKKNNNRFAAALLVLVAAAPPAVASNLDASTFDNALAAAAQMPRLHSVLISYEGELVLEEYFNGARPSHTANVKSVSKTIMSALVGLAIEQGHIESLDQSIADYYGEIINGDAAKSAITVGNLLSMQAGLETTSFYNYGAWVLSDDWFRFALEQPMRAEPGTRLVYSTGNTHLLSGIITQATGRSTYQFARSALAQPMGIELNEWQKDPNGFYFGGNNMEFTPRQMMAFGQMYINGGKIGDRQVIPADWVERSTQPLVGSPRDLSRSYGYGWWIKDMVGFEAPYAWGYGGQFIMLVPELDLVIVTTSSSQPGNGRRQHIRGLYRLLEHQVIKEAASEIIRPPLAPRRSRMDSATD